MQALSTLIEAIGWALLHSLWQFSAIAILLYVAIRIATPKRTRLVYALSCFGMILCLSIPFISILLQMNVAGAPVTIPQLSSAQPVFQLSSIAIIASTGSYLQAFEKMIAEHIHQIVFVWLSIVGLLSLRFVMGLSWMHWQSRYPLNQNHFYLQHMVDELSKKLQLKLSVKLRVVNHVVGPVTMGCFKPMVLLPAALVCKLDVRMLEALLAHELAHIKRYDYVFNLLQNVVEILFFYHPAVWWISKQICYERENIADDIAAEILGEPRRLALALQELELFQFSTSQLALGAHGGDLMSRITRLIRPQQQSFGWRSMVVSLGVVAMSAALVAQADNLDFIDRQTQLPKPHFSNTIASEVGDRNEDIGAKSTALELSSTSIPAGAPSKVDESLDAPSYLPLNSTGSLMSGVNGGSSSTPDVTKLAMHATPVVELEAMPLLRPESIQTTSERPTTNQAAPSHLIDAPDGKVLQFKSPRIDLSDANCRPNLPALSYKIVPSGVSMVKVTVAENGSILSVSNIKSSGLVELDEALKNAVSKASCKAVPGIVNGQAYASETTLALDWSTFVNRVQQSNERDIPSLDQNTTHAAIVHLDGAECKPEYPKASVRNLEEGITEAQIDVSVDGRISNVKVVRSSGFRGLDKSLVATLMSGNCKASPSKMNGVAVASTIEFAHVWKLSTAK
ncbi:M56 family metallopeptidase [Undibacterium cyanobacteriorum]|uniref:M56 family metallopeptidase n=1 Tax=Undibacterium cyanobacteriorum TaxID=3073561 RepID=A0ABY9RF95_9BURK|nr:M56 family metallopeptidase [Undibacterium sp. 20NA77.5]WMW78985.1 M56 family metallopeptidase [Undibacterium sp. 20NA77.5]